MFGTEGIRVRNIREDMGSCDVGVVVGPGPTIDPRRPETFVKWDYNGETLWIYDEFLELEEPDHEATKAWMNFLVQVTTHKLKFKPLPLDEQDFTDRELVCLATALHHFSLDYDDSMLAGAFMTAVEKINAKLGERVINFDRNTEGFVTAIELRDVARIRG